MKYRNTLIIIMLSAVLWLIAAPDPPIANMVYHENVVHGDTLVDEYCWLKDKSRTDPEVLEYLQMENDYTQAMMSSTRGLQDTLYNEFRSRIPDEDSSIPYKLGNYWYYSREEPGKQYSLYCRKYNEMTAEEEVYFDQNLLAVNKEYLAVSGMKISTDENMLAYLADYTGAEVYNLYIKNIQSGDLLADSLANVDDICWANDNETLFYCTSDESGRTDKVWWHRLGTEFNTDELIYEEPDSSFYCYVYKSKSREYIIVGTSSKTSSEIRILKAENPWGELQLVEPRRPDIEYYLTHHEDEFFISTNEDAKNFKLMRVNENTPQRKYWQEFIPHRDNVTFNISIFRTHLILFETENYQNRIRVIGLDNDEDYLIMPPDETAILYSGFMPEYNSTSFRYLVESMQSPWRSYEYDLITRDQILLKKQQVNGYQDGIYVSERLYATAADGEQIPISIVYNKDTFSRDCKHPMFLTAYGAYGDNSNPYFSTTKLSLLDRGYSWAIAHVRGGGEMGRRWYEAGRMEHKKNSFTDFIACTEYLIAENYTSSEQLAIEGASAGGLLIGAVMNMRPDLYEVVIGDVPFVDMMNTMLDPTLSATVSEYEEWGNPNIRSEFEYMLSYCPYYNVKAQDYPNILLLGGFYDPRVNYWEPAKLCAKLRRMKTDDNLLLLKINDAGHGGSSGRYDYLKEIAFEFAFIIDRLSAN
ncbi:MAG: S9 family peptidase [Candidatus Stygibacter australis]|nr:S9 family peptidase [Candidatus Stygibacter australis]MDP8320858.1 S9 family peptidase [Candidatus Stygibacter australis]